MINLQENWPVGKLFWLKILKISWAWNLLSVKLIYETIFAVWKYDSPNLK